MITSSLCLLHMCTFAFICVRAAVHIYLLPVIAKIYDPCHCSLKLYLYLLLWYFIDRKFVINILVGLHNVLVLAAVVCLKLYRHYKLRTCSRFAYIRGQRRHTIVSSRCKQIKIIHVLRRHDKLAGRHQRQFIRFTW